eukprot:1157234-Pelagomonas_calceolata.AAC.22
MQPIPCSAVQQAAPIMAPHQKHDTGSDWRVPEWYISIHPAASGPHAPIPAYKQTMLAIWAQHRGKPQP